METVTREPERDRNILTVLDVSPDELARIFHAIDTLHKYSKTELEKMAQQHRDQHPTIAKAAEALALLRSTLNPFIP